MKVFPFPHPVAVFMLCFLLTGATACSDNGSGRNSAPEKPHKTQLISLKQACGGKVFDERTYKEIVSSRRGGTLRDGVQADGVKYGMTKEASQYLGVEVDASSDAKVTCFVDGASGGEAELEVQFGWWPEAFPSKTPDPGIGAVFRSGDAFELLVDCRISDSSTASAKPKTLRGTIVDRVGLTGRTAAKILIASAREVTAGMNCSEPIKFPDPPKVQDGLK
ncbi:hypothetical protein [Streptomyces venezuelae]|uniref:hypothetical protein n=1 Tax=Streptomyces venezuelae TaxID=54571 RepID=UPI00123A3014|nr:hypothetical protein [Streptomyces venezuelae]